MKTVFKIFAVALITSVYTVSASAQDKFNVNGKADLVSNYVWRGSDQNSGVSIQPYLTFSYKGAFFTVNGSQSITNAQTAPQEFDLNLGYGWKGLSLTISDYWWEGMQAAYGHYLTGHHFEATAAWSMKEICHIPLNLSWSTWFAGFDDYKSDAEGQLGRAFSSYFSVSFNISIPSDITLSPSIGITPWQGVYLDKAGVTDISIKAEKQIAITEHFSLPFFVQAIYAPHDSSKGVDKTYLVTGLSLGF